VIGNPPWTAKATSIEKRAWVAPTRRLVRERVGDDRAAKFDFPDTNPDLPFVYRSMEWAVSGGSIALVTHARWLFGQSPRASAARRDLLECLHITGLLNGTALRDSNVWPNVRHPFCLLFAVNERAPKDATLQFISPELERTPDRLQDHIRIDWNDARDVAIAEISRCPWKLKALFRGSSIDESVLDDVHRRGVTLGKYLKSIGAKLSNGYQVGGRAGKQQSAKRMAGLPDLKGSSPDFLVDADVLPKFSRSKLLFPRERAIYNAPLLLVHESIRADPMAPRAILALEDVAYDERFTGASLAEVDQGTQIAEYLQLAIQSSLFTHIALFLDGQFGVEREVVHKETIEAVPVVPWAQLSRRLRSRSKGLSERLRGGMTGSLLADIDAFAADVFELSDVQRDAIAETLAVSLPTAAAKGNATRDTNEQERALFTETCEVELADLLDEKIRVCMADIGEDGPWRFIRVHRLNGSTPPVLLDFDIRRILDVADEGSASLITIDVDHRTVLVGQLDRYRYWTKTRARLLAAALVSEGADG
jgi:hypothetical protein